jgi:pimeloyl-ACP methyl ester carboxylesterase
MNEALDKSEFPSAPPLTLSVDGVERVFDINHPKLPGWVKDRVLTAAGYPYDQKLKREVYEKQLEALEIDLGRLGTFPAPALLTAGRQSPPFFPVVVDRLAEALAQAQRYTYAEAGHVPHLSHSDEYVRVVAGFIQGAAASSSRALSGA